MISIVGCGTLGSRLARKLSDKKLLLIDHDVVDESNIPAQKYSIKDIGLPKVSVLAQELKARGEKIFLNKQNISLLEESEVIIDCTDNLNTRREIGRYAYEQGIPVIHAAADTNKGIFAVIKHPFRLDAVYYGKVSVGGCRGSMIDISIAEKLSDMQEEAARNIGSSDTSCFLVYKDKKTPLAIKKSDSVKLSEDNFYITFCTKENCFKSVMIKPKGSKEKKFVVRGVGVEVLNNSEILFRGAKEVDLCEQIARSIYSK